MGAVTGHTLHHAIGKREAEADPAYFYSGLGYGHGLYGLGYGYGAGYAGYGYGLGYRTHGYGLGYRTHGYGHYIGKRSADAEPAADADADAYYGYGYGCGYGYHGYGYGGYRGYLVADTTVTVWDTDTTDTESKKLESTQT